MDGPQTIILLYRNNGPKWCSCVRGSRVIYRDVSGWRWWFPALYLDVCIYIYSNGCDCFRWSTSILRVASCHTIVERVGGTATIYYTAHRLFGLHINIFFVFLFFFFVFRFVYQLNRLARSRVPTRMLGERGSFHKIVSSVSSDCSIPSSRLHHSISSSRVTLPSLFLSINWNGKRKKSHYYS